MSLLLIRSWATGEWKICGEIFPTSFLWRSISREPRMGLAEENGTYKDGFTSADCWRSRPNGRGHIDMTVRGSGTDTTSPVTHKCQKKKVYKNPIGIMNNYDKRGNVIYNSDLSSHTHLKCCILLNSQFVRHKEKLLPLDPGDSSMPMASLNKKIYELKKQNSFTKKRT